MIQANVLRIGNWVNYVGIKNIVLGIQSPSPQQQLYLSDKYLVEINPPDSFYAPIDDISPIPLEPEILEKCGLKRTGNLAASASCKFYMIGGRILVSVSENKVSVCVS